MCAWLLRVFLCDTHVFYMHVVHPFMLQLTCTIGIVIYQLAIYRAEHLAWLFLTCIIFSLQNTMTLRRLIKSKMTLWRLIKSNIRNSMETTLISNSSVPYAKPDIPIIKLEKKDCDHTYENSSNLKCDSKKSSTSSVTSKKSLKFHSCFLRKLSQNKVSNVNCNRLLLADSKMTVYWSDCLTKINCKFPNVIQACHMNKVSYDEGNI